MIYAGAAILAFAAFWLLLHYLKKETAGRARAEATGEIKDNVLDKVKEGNKAVDSLNDPDERKRVQDRFTER